MSLRLRILALVCASSLLPLLVVLWTLLESRSAAIAQARDRIGIRAAQLAAELDDKVSGTAQLLFGLSRANVLESGDVAACSDFLADVLSAHPHYAGLLTVRPDGWMKCDSLRTGRKLNVSDRNYFKRALQAQGIVTESAIGRLTGKGVLQIAYPARQADGSLAFVLLASINLDEFGGNAARSLPYGRMNLQLWNHDGSLVLDYPAEGMARLLPEVSERAFVLAAHAPKVGESTRGGDGRLWAVAPLSAGGGTGIRLVLSVPQDELEQAADRQFRNALYGMVPMVLLILVATALLGELALRRQAQRVVQGIARLDAGEYEEALGPPYPRGELGMVMSALDRMGRSLRQQREELQLNTQQLERQATIDALTGLANRALLTDRLAQALIHARRRSGGVGVLLLDLDRFKTVNDSLGHRSGDELLQGVARRLRACVREGDTVARLGGDEFVLVLPAADGMADVAPVAQKILDGLLQPLEVNGHPLTVGASIGVAIFPTDGLNADDLLQHADLAMYRAKALGGNVVAYFSVEMMEASVERLRLEAGLRRAIDLGEFVLHYQPVMSADGMRVVSAEALIRWLDPERGQISPAVFIGVAEETGLIVQIGEWVLRTACAQAVAWRRQGLGELPIAVNISPRQFRSPAFDRVVAGVLSATGCPPALLHLELTESSIIDQPEAALLMLERLNALGVGLSIDDFGTGYSSLSRLKQLPVEKLKIDRSFVREIERDDSDQVIVEMIIMLARKLGLRTVAEGVETETQRAMLRALGCDELQGFLFAAAMEAPRFERFVGELSPV